MTIWNKNYLGDESQPWARQLQKEIDNQKSAFQTADINNTKRDAQLASSLRQVQAAAIAASTANANAIQALQDASDANTLATTANSTAIDANAAAIDAAAEAAQAALDAADAATLASTANTNALAALQDIIDLGSVNGPTINASNIKAGTISAIDITSSEITGGTINGTEIYAAFIETPGEVSTPYVNAGVVFANQSFEGTVNTTIASNTTSSFAGNVFINTSGNMFRSTTTSSREAKENIKPYEFDTQAFISVNPVTFNYKQEAVSDPEEAQINQIGFIVEDFEAIGLGEHLVVPANEMDNYKGLRYDKLYMFLHKTVQAQADTIRALEARIEALEAR